MSRLYLRDLQLVGYAAGERSVSKPGGALAYNSSVNFRMTEAKGAAQVLLSNQSSNPTTTHQDAIMGRFISDPINVAQIDAEVWLLAVAVAEANANANAFLAASLYVLKADDTIRGFIYDSENIAGATEFPTVETGQIVSLVGSAVAGCVNTDRLVLEVWWHTATQGMGTSYTRSLWANGTTDVVQAATTSDAASWLDTPQNLFGTPPVVVNDDFFAFI